MKQSKKRRREITCKGTRNLLFRSSNYFTLNVEKIYFPFISILLDFFIFTQKQKQKKKFFFSSCTIVCTFFGECTYSSPQDTLDVDSGDGSCLTIYQLTLSTIETFFLSVLSYFMYTIKKKKT